MQSSVYAQSVSVGRLDICDNYSSIRLLKKQNLIKIYRIAFQLLPLHLATSCSVRKNYSVIVYFFSELVEISSDLVEISSELVQISSELVYTISELLIISAFKSTRNVDSRIAPTSGMQGS